MKLQNLLKCFTFSGVPNKLTGPKKRVDLDLFFISVSENHVEDGFLIIYLGKNNVQAGFFCQKNQSTCLFIRNTRVGT